MAYTCQMARLSRYTPEPSVLVKVNTTGDPVHDIALESRSIPLMQTVTHKVAGDILILASAIVDN